MATRTPTFGGDIAQITNGMESCYKRRRSPGGIRHASVGCVGNAPWNNIQTCISINGGGLHVNYMAADSNCAISWVLNGNGGYNNAGEACAPVHP
jgi:hypothetical protein